MEAKLIKVEDVYRLLREDNLIIGTTDYEYQKAFSDHCYKLSLKNCQAIERGYDLDELAKTTFPSLENCGVHLWMSETDRNRQRSAFIKGFQKALELLGDKKFSEEDMINAFKFGWERRTNEKSYYQSYEDFFVPLGIPSKELQQTEWEVVVEMEYDESCCKDRCQDPELDICDDGCAMATLIPKLDADGCIVLKRKQINNNLN